MTKNQKTFSDNKLKSTKLLEETPIWLAMLKLGSTAIAISFLTAAFLFIAQIMIVNFMPKTSAYDFHNLFVKDKTLFNPLFNKDVTISKSLVFAISNSTLLGFFNTAGVARSSISLTAGELNLVAMFPSILVSGVTVFYAKSLGIKNYTNAKLVWQNSIVAGSIASFVGFLLMMILTPTVIPNIAVKSNLDQAKVDALIQEINQHLISIHAQELSLSQSTHTLSIFVNNNNYYLQVLYNNKIGYLNITNQSILKANDIVYFNNDNLSVITVNTNQLLPVWTNYFSTVRSYSIKWAESFAYIMALIIILQTYGGIIVSLLRTDGEIKWTTFVSVLSVLLSVLLNYILIDLSQLGLTGAAIAGVLSVFFQLVCYVLLMQFHKTALCKLQDLKHTKVEWDKILKILSRGANKFIGGTGNTTLLILLANQLTYVSNELLPASGSEYFIAIMGAILPFVSIFTSTMLGGTKNFMQLFSYNYAQKNYKRFYDAFWFTFIYGLILGVVLFLLFGLCDPIKIGILSWFHITKQTSDFELQSALRLMLIWMIQIPCFAFALDGTVIFLVMGKLKYAYLVSALRTWIIPIPVLFIFSTVAIHYSIFFGVSNLPYLNNAMWFFIDVGPTYTGLFCLVVFILSLFGLYNYVNKAKTLVKINRIAILKDANIKINVDLNDK